MNNLEMYHWGVKGMKWGVRRDRKRPSDKAIRDARERLRVATEEYNKLEPEYARLSSRRLTGRERKKFDNLDKRLDSLAAERYDSYEIAKYSTRGEIVMRTLKVSGAMATMVAAAFVASRSGDWVEAAIKSAFGK